MTHASPQLIVTAGPARGRSIPLEGSVSIGRDEQNALPITNPALSRRHCVIDANESRILLTDLNSKNGVFVNGCPITQRELSDGDQIRIGDSAMVVVMPGHTVRTDDAVEVIALDDTPIPAYSTIAIDAAGSRYLNRGPIAHRGDSRAPADLGVLVGLSRRAPECGHRRRPVQTAADARPGGGARMARPSRRGVWRRRLDGCAVKTWECP